ncbi:MAG: hypothetical protein ACQEXI_00240 [Pseudomonadota bacterium]
MKVRTYGFDVYTENLRVGIPELMQHLQERSGEEDNSKNVERRIYVDCNAYPDFYVGLIVTVKDHKNFCKLEESDEGVTVTVESLTGDDKLMEFNFFVLNKKNGIGLYQHYHQSCAVRVFGAYLVSRHARLRRRLKAEALDYDALSAAEQRDISREFSPKLEFSQLVTKETLREMLERYKEIRSFEFAYTYLRPKKKRGRPLEKRVAKKREKLYFRNPEHKMDLAKEIGEFVKSKKPLSGNVNAVDHSGEAKVLKIFDMPDTFSEEEYDDVAIKLNNLRLHDFAGHKVMKELISICRSDEFRHIFEADAE